MLAIYLLLEEQNHFFELCFFNVFGTLRGGRIFIMDDLFQDLPDDRAASPALYAHSNDYMYTL